MKRKILSTLVALCVAISCAATGAFPETTMCARAAQIAENLQVVVNQNTYTVKALHQEYSNNAYLSIRDLAMALRGTDKEYNVSFTTIDKEDAVVIKYGTYGVVGGENEVFKEATYNMSFSKNVVSINGQNGYFYGIRGKNSEGNSDFYMSTGELAIMLDMDMEYQDGVLHITPDKSYAIDMEHLEEQGFFHMTTSCLVGDATTGEIYYSREEDKAVAIASTTKLMTYYVIMDGVTNGEISLDDRVVFSEEAERESNTENGIVRLTAGESAPIREVIQAMLIKSSNECALALAEHLCGSSEQFVERMNAKARELGLSEDAHFFNTNGLPMYLTDEVMSAKMQNRMTAEDMFILVSNLLATYPQVTEVTSVKKTHLDTFDLDLTNTNNLLFIFPEVVGLKTGTTTKAGSCLVAAARMEDESGMEHYIVTIVYGAENANIQTYTSTTLMAYGMQHFAASTGGASGGMQPKVPAGPEELIRQVISAAKRGN